jgi:hypothetical protein
VVRAARWHAADQGSILGILGLYWMYIALYQNCLFVSFFIFID